MFMATDIQEEGQGQVCARLSSQPRQWRCLGCRAAWLGAAAVCSLRPFCALICQGRLLQ